MDISKKVVTLMVLLPGTDVNTLTRLKVTKMFITENEFSFTSDKVLKNSRPNYFQKPIAFQAYLECPSLCPFVTLLEYLQV